MMLNITYFYTFSQNDALCAGFLWLFISLFFESKWKTHKQICFTHALALEVWSGVLVDPVSTCLPGMVSLLTQFLLVFQGLCLTMQWGTSRPGARSTGMLADHVVLVLCFITPDELRNSLPEMLAVVDGALEVLSQALSMRGCGKADSAEGRAIRAVMCQLSADRHYYLDLYVYSRV